MAIDRNGVVWRPDAPAFVDVRGLKPIWRSGAATTMAMVRLRHVPGGVGAGGDALHR
ncbi:MAG: hypothetical protein R2854_15410 [Caldilineaceae bacterium]